MTSITNYTDPLTTNMSDSQTSILVSLGISSSLQIGVTLLTVIIFVASLVGNTVVIYIVCTAEHMRNSVNTLIANMAVADLLMTIDLPYVVKWLFVYDKWFGTFAGSALCKFFHSAPAASVVGSVFSLMAISLDRAFAILLPMKTIFTRKVVRICIALSWLGALGFAVPVMMATSVVDVGHMSCNEDWLRMSRYAYHVAFTVLAFIVPLVLMAVIHVAVGLKLSNRKLPGNESHLSRAKASSKRATRMLITVVVVFALSWLPFHVREMIFVFNPTLAWKMPIEVLILIPFVGYANSAVNPILYVIFSENYRREFNRVLCGGQSRRDLYRRIVISQSASRLPRMSTENCSNAIPLCILTNTGTSNPQDWRAERISL